jgi:hypothetical protein
MSTTAANLGLEETRALEERYLMRTYKRGAVDFVRGEGALLWDAEGNEYLDFLTGISVCSLGHCHPAVVAAVVEQTQRLMHVSNLFYTEPMARLAQRLSEHRSERVRDQDRPQARSRPRGHGAGDHQLRGRVPRSQLRRALGYPRAGEERKLLADAARLPLGSAQRRGGAARGGEREHRGGPDRADPG